MCVCIYIYVYGHPPQEPPKTHLTQELQLYPNTLDTVFNWLHLTQSSTSLCTPPRQNQDTLAIIFNWSLHQKWQPPMPHCLSGSSILHNTTTRNQKKLKNKLYLETLWVGPHPENQKKTKNKYLETLWGEPHPENQKRKEPWKNKKQYLETLGWTYMCFLIFFPELLAFYFFQNLGWTHWSRRQHMKSVSVAFCCFRAGIGWPSYFRLQLIMPIIARP